MRVCACLVAVVAILAASLSGFVVTALQIATAGYFYVIPNRMPPAFYRLSVINWICLCVYITACMLMPVCICLTKRKNHYERGSDA